jgi:hypothetical protein
MDIEVTGAEPVPEPGAGPRRQRGTLYVVVALVVGAAFGFAVANARPAEPARMSVMAAPVTPSAAGEAPGLPGALRERMLARVRQYNQAEPDAVEASEVRLMTSQRDNVVRLDDERAYPRGDYRLQVICLGEGQVWALFRIGDDETYVDMDCHDEHVLVTQLLLTARADGKRAVTLVSDSRAGVAVGFQVLRRG